MGGKGGVAVTIAVCGMQLEQPCCAAEFAVRQMVLEAVRSRSRWLRT